jgi:hypothetical protein
MQFDGLKKCAVSDSGQSLVNVIFLFFLKDFRVTTHCTEVLEVERLPYLV